MVEPSVGFAGVWCHGIQPVCEIAQNLADASLPGHFRRDGLGGSYRRFDVALTKLREGEIGAGQGAVALQIGA